MNFIPDQEQQQPPGAEGETGAPSFGAEDTTFVTGEEAPKKPNKQMMMLLGLAVVGAGVIWFMYFRPGPQPAAAAEAAGPDTVTTFLASGDEHVHLMKQMLLSTDKVVQRFRQSSTQTQVPLAALRTNPFRQKAPDAGPVNESEAAARRRREEERESAASAVTALKVQSIVYGSRYQACMINNKMYQPGQRVDGLLIEQVKPGAVVVRCGAFRFEVTMQR